MATIHTYGDSNTYGIGDPKRGGYAARLRNTMMERMANPTQGKRGVIVHNFGRFAMTLPRIVETLPEGLANGDGRGRIIAVAMIGFSESIVPDRAVKPVVPLPEFRRALDGYAAACQRASRLTDRRVISLFIESPPIELSGRHPDLLGEICPERYAAYKTAVQEHAHDTKSAFVEIHPALHDLPYNPLNKDGIHLSVDGHVAVHNVVLPYIDDILQS